MIMKFGIIIKSKKGVLEYRAFVGEFVIAYNLLVGELN
jgi:hypothetical protein